MQSKLAQHGKSQTWIDEKNNFNQSKQLFQSIVVYASLFGRLFQFGGLCHFVCQ